MAEISKKIPKKKQELDILNKGLDFKKLNFSKILAMSIIGILIISLGIGIFYEFKDKNASEDGSVSQDKITSAIEYDCNYVWFQQIVNKATREIIWTCNSARPYCKAGTTQCCQWTEATGHYNCYDMNTYQQVEQNNSGGSNGGSSGGGTNNLGCLDSDNGKEIWIKGNCNGNNDYCTQNFGKELHEYYCNVSTCTKETIDCTNYSARCYDGRCIKTNQDTDGDGFFDLDEYEAGTNPNDPTSNPNTVNQQLNCSLTCKNAGYEQGRGPFGYESSCNTLEAIEYLPGESGLLCCCTPKNVSIPTMEYDCNYTWYQQIVNKANPLQVIWTCTYDRPFCKAGTTQCCQWTQATGHYDCYDRLLNQVVPPEGLTKSIIFVTSTTYSGNLGGLSGADSKCQARANAAGLSGTWVALLSSASVNAKDRILDIPYETISGKSIATSKADLFDGVISNPIDISELGTQINSGPNPNIYEDLVWTGTNADGVYSGKTCYSWTDSTNMETTIGRTYHTDYRWIHLGDQTWCSNPLHLYCVKISA